MKTKFKVVLSMAHIPDESQASHGKIKEYGLSSAVIGDLAFRLDKLGHEAWIIGADSNKNQVERINEIKPDFGLEIHFNAHIDHEMNGTEVLYSGGEQGGRLAIEISNAITTTLGTRDRGCPVGYYMLDPKNSLIEIIRKTVCPFVVPEVLFLSNAGDREKIEIPLISVGILRGILSYWEGQG